MTTGWAGVDPPVVPGRGGEAKGPLPNDVAHLSGRYRRPTKRHRLEVAPQLASWERAGHPSQLRLAVFLAHFDAVAGPIAAAGDQRLAIELVVGLPASASLTAGGRDLDNYLYPVAQHVGPARVAAMFGRKVHGASTLAVEAAHPHTTATPARFTTRVAGSYTRTAWKQTLRDRLLQARVDAARPGPIAMQVPTSGQIVHAGGRFDPRRPPRILGGLLAGRSDWSPPFGQSLRDGLDNLAEDERIDLGCGLEHGAFELPEGANAGSDLVTAAAEVGLAFFAMRLMARLQQMGSVPSMNIDGYTSVISQSGDVTT